MRNPLITLQNKEEMRKIRDIAVTWYEKYCKDKEIEFFDYDLSRSEGRLKIFILGIFFNCVFQEGKALDIFNEMEQQGYIDLTKLDDFEVNIKNVIRILERKTGERYGILKMQNLIDSVHAAKKLFSKKDDIIGIYRKQKTPKQFIRFLKQKLQGITIKLFWICREYRDVLKIPKEYCYVPDRHVTRFLYNIKLLSRRKITYSLEECFKISRAMSEYLDNKYFDLPFMRYHQEKCKDKKGCTCELDCRFNPISGGIHTQLTH